MCQNTFLPFACIGLTVYMTIRRELLKLIFLFLSFKLATLAPSFLSWKVYFCNCSHGGNEQDLVLSWVTRYVFGESN